MANPTAGLVVASPTSMRIIRQLRGLTLRQLQDKCGINVAMLCMAERGRLLLDDRQLLAIASALDVPTTLLTTEPDEILRAASNSGGRR